MPGENDLNWKHYETFAENKGIGCTWNAARIPQVWASGIGASEEVCAALPDKSMNREELTNFCANVDLMPEVRVAAVMAWGGMKYDHGRRLWSCRENWRALVKGLSDPKLARADAYEQFRNFRRNNPGSGMGPAYFTKLIFFCSPRQDGYIMDQWTSLGVNLLFKGISEPVVRLIVAEYRGRRTDTVSDGNCGKTYEKFCLCIESLGKSLQGTAPQQIEEWLFSSGGRNPAPWRSYVRANRP